MERERRERSITQRRRGAKREKQREKEWRVLREGRVKEMPCRNVKERFSIHAKTERLYPSPCSLPQHSTPNTQYFLSPLSLLCVLFPLRELCVKISNTVQYMIK
jgi:hypothetical protein